MIREVTTPQLTGLLYGFTSRRVIKPSGSPVWHDIALGHADLTFPNMYTLHDERDSSLLRTGFAVGITSLCLLMAGVVLGNSENLEHSKGDPSVTEIIHASRGVMK